MTELLAPEGKVQVCSLLGSTHQPQFATDAERDAYERGVADGNREATRILVGCRHPIRVVVDESVPDGEAHLHVRTAEHIYLPRIPLGLLMP